MAMIRVQRAASVLKSPGIQTAAVMNVCGTPRIRKPSIRLKEEMFQNAHTGLGRTQKAQGCAKHANKHEHKTAQGDAHVAKTASRQKQSNSTDLCELRCCGQVNRLVSWQGGWASVAK